MVHGCEKKQWVMPTLEMVEMAHTQQGVPPLCNNGQPKQNTGRETGNCGHYS